MDNRPKRKKAKNRAFSPILKHLRNYLYYEIEATTKLSVPKKDVIDLFLDHIGVHTTKNKQDTILDLYFNKAHPLLDDVYILVLRKKIRNKRGIPVQKLKYNDYLRSPQWRQKRQQLFEQRGKCCERCGLDMGELGISPDVHHKTYDNLFNEPLEDLEVLCRPCHKKHHGK